MIEIHLDGNAVTKLGTARDDLLDALRAIREALDIPPAATVGDEKTREPIMKQRVMHVVVMLHSILAPDRYPDIPWSTAYLRERVAEHPAEGYKTWQELAAETGAARKGGDAR